MDVGGSHRARGELSNLQQDPFAGMLRILSLIKVILASLSSRNATLSVHLVVSIIWPFVVVRDGVSLPKTCT